MLLATLRAELGAELPEADIHEGWNSVALADKDPPVVVTGAAPLCTLCCCSAGDMPRLFPPSRGLAKAGNIPCRASGASYFLHKVVVNAAYWGLSRIDSSLGRTQAGEAVITAPI